MDGPIQRVREQRAVGRARGGEVGGEGGELVKEVAARCRDLAWVVRRQRGE